MLDPSSPEFVYQAMLGNLERPVIEYARDHNQAVADFFQKILDGATPEELRDIVHANVIHFEAREQELKDQELGL